MHSWIARLPLCFALLACGPGSSDSRPDTDSGPTLPVTTDATSEPVDPTSSGGVVPTSSGDTSTGDGTTTLNVSGTSTGGETTTLETSAGVTSDPTTGGFKLDLPVPEDMPIPVHDIPGLVSITFYESTSGVTESTFLVDGPELSTLLADPLTNANRDIEGTSVEFYDVYYSDIDGVFDPDGSYLTIAGSFGAKLPAGGGLNLAEISLNYADNSVEYGSFLASFVGLGDNYIMGSEPNAIDGNLDTHTTMGNTVDTPDQRLRVTLGFKSSLMPG